MRTAVSPADAAHQPLRRGAAIPSAAAGARLRRVLLWGTTAWTCGAALVAAWNLGEPPRTFDFVRHSNSATWLIAALFGLGAGAAVLLWALDDDAAAGWLPVGRWGWLAAAAALLWLSLDAVAGLQAHELPRLANFWVNAVHALGDNRIDGDEIPPVTSPLTACAALGLLAGVLRLRGIALLLTLGLAGLALLGGAALLEWRRLLVVPHKQLPSRDLVVAIDLARIGGSTLLLWALTLRLRSLLLLAHP
jgi:hypothetical protein